MAQNVLAVVAGHQITEEELQAFIGHLPKEQQAYASNPQFKEHCKEQLITFHAPHICGQVENTSVTGSVWMRRREAIRDQAEKILLRLHFMHIRQNL